MLHLDKNQSLRKTDSHINVILSNFSLLTTTNELSELLNTVGAYLDLKIIKNEGKSFALVKYKELSQALKCQQFLKYRMFKGQHLQVSIVNSPEQNLKIGQEEPPSKYSSLEQQIIDLSEHDKIRLYGLLSRLTSEHNMLQKFFQDHPRLLQALLINENTNN